MSRYICEVPGGGPTLFEKGYSKASQRLLKGSSKAPPRLPFLVSVPQRRRSPTSMSTRKRSSKGTKKKGKKKARGGTPPGSGASSERLQNFDSGLAQVFRGFFPRETGGHGTTAQEDAFLWFFWTKVFSYCRRAQRDAVRLASKAGARIIHPLIRYVHVSPPHTASLAQALSAFKTSRKAHPNGCRAVVKLSDHDHKTGYIRKMYVHPNFPASSRKFAKVSGVDHRALRLQNAVEGARCGVSAQPHDHEDKMFQGLRLHYPGCWFAVYETNGTSPTSITVAEGVEVLVRQAFYGVRMSYLLLPDSLTTLRDRVCAHCVRLREIRIPPKVTELPNSAFLHCANLVDVTLPPNLHTFKGHCFHGCYNLETFRSEGVLELEEGVFAHCHALKTVFVPSADRFGRKCFQGCIALQRVEAGKVLYFGNSCFDGCQKLTCVNTPLGDNVFHNPFLPGDQENGVGSRAFANTGLTNVTFVGNVVRIPPETFCHCTALRSVSIRRHGNTRPPPLAILKKAFMGCSKLETLDIAEANVGFIGVSAFQGCGLSVLKLPPTVQTVYSRAFAYCAALVRTDLPDGLVEVEDELFLGCAALQTVTVPKTVTCIRTNAFYGCWKLTEVKFVDGNRLESIGIGAFENCFSLAGFRFPPTLQRIGSRAFARCKLLSEVNLPPSLICLGREAFAHCAFLCKVCFAPDTPCFSTVRSRVFYGCEALENLRLPASTTSIATQAFGKCPELRRVTAPWCNIHAQQDVFAGSGNVCRVNIEETS